VVERKYAQIPPRKVRCRSLGNWEGALEEISRVLKPQGFFIFGDLAYSRFTTRIFKPIAKNYGVYTIDDLIHYLRRNNFEIIYREEPKGSNNEIL